MKKLIFVLLIGLLTSYGSSEEKIIKIVNKEIIRQGHCSAVFIISKKDIKSCVGYLNRRKIRFFNVYKNKIYRAIFGIDVAFKPGKKNFNIYIKLKNGKRIYKRRKIKIVKHVFAKTVTRRGKPTYVVKFNKKMRAIIRDREALKRERIIMNRALSVISPYQLWTNKFILPARWYKYRWKKKNGKIIKFVRKNPVFGAQRFNVVGNRTVVRYHRGIDYPNYKNTPILCAASGKVILARFLKVRGGSIVIDHGQGILSVYYHLNKILVKKGARVTQSQLIAKMGTTGLSTGSHLHFEIRAQGVSITPNQWYKYRFYLPFFH